MNAQRLEELLLALEEDSLTPQDLAELKHLLTTEPQARKRLVAAGVLESVAKARLQALKVLEPAEQRPSMSTSRKPALLGWLQFRPLTAAAAGLVIGTLCTSMVFAYVVPRVGKAITLLQEGFESGPAPLITGMPIMPGQWSGDYSEVTGEYHGVQPAGGRKMLRFLRADYEGKPVRDGYMADLFRIVDLRGAQFDIAPGDACISVEAKFCALPQKDPARLRNGIIIYALDELPEPGERHDFFLKRRARTVEAGDSTPEGGVTILATAARDEMAAGANESWRGMRCELRVPPGTRYIMIHLHGSFGPPHGDKASDPVEFAGLFMDDIRATLTHQPPLP